MLYLILEQGQHLIYLYGLFLLTQDLSDQEQLHSFLIQFLSHLTDFVDMQHAFLIHHYFCAVLQHLLYL